MHVHAFHSTTATYHKMLHATPYFLKKKVDECLKLQKSLNCHIRDKICAECINGAFSSVFISVFAVFVLAGFCYF